MKKSINSKQILRLFATGFAMGSADIVPGVSGGTVAFLMGIYEQLIQSIKTMSSTVPKLVLKGKFTEAWKNIPFLFLTPLAIGIFSAIFSLSNLVSYLLKTYPEFVWSFFFGLVVATILVVRKNIKKWTNREYLVAGVFAVLAYLIVGAVPVETPNTLPALFISGAIAICAMILPGVSGSFLLVIMGKYEQVLGAVVQKDLLSLAVFGSGAIVGLGLFSRLLSWLFKKHHDIVMAALIGFLIGSLRKVWPWKEVVMTRINSHGLSVPVVENNVLPEFASFEFLLCIALMVVGLIIVFSLEKVQLTKTSKHAK